MGGRSAVARLLCLAWSALLLGLMATGTFTSARIGELRWSPEADIWAAAIAISQINFGLPGHRGYHEIESAMVEELNSKPGIWDPWTEETRGRLKDPAAVTRSFKAASAITREDLVVPSVKAGYLIDWGDDVGFHDFHNLAFRVFGFNALSTHWLYFSFLGAACIMFAAVFRKDNIAIGSLTLSLTALFLLSSCPFFNELVPNYPSGRFISTLAIVPLLHVVHAALRRIPLGWPELVPVGAQAWIMTLAITARGSAGWSILALVACGLAIFVVRKSRMPNQEHVAGGRTNRLTTRLAFPGADEVVIVSTVALAVFFMFAIVRSPWLDSDYFGENDYPHHLFWHNAYLGLQLNPDWMVKRPNFPEVDAGGDGAGFGLFYHFMHEQGLPNAWAAHPEYSRARPYEAFIRDQYLKFAVQNPLYMAKLFFYYKPTSFYTYIRQMIGGLPATSVLLAACSLALTCFCFAFAGSTILLSELSLCSVVIWLSSLAPLVWTYPGGHVDSDAIWSSFYVLLIFLGWLSNVLTRAAFGSGAVQASAAEHATP